jgi:hypothetical protein
MTLAQSFQTTLKKPAVYSQNVKMWQRWQYYVPNILSTFCSFWPAIEHARDAVEDRDTYSQLLYPEEVSITFTTSFKIPNEHSSFIDYVRSLLLGIIR